jgi:imidazolonepropionase-like amidohydrolase
MLLLTSVLVRGMLFSPQYLCQSHELKLYSFIKLMQEDGCALSLPFPTRPIPTPSLGIQKAVVDAAHKNGMLAVAHALTNDSVLQVLDAGVDGLTHSSLEPINSTIVNAFKDTKAFLIPTLAVHASSSGEDKHTRESFAANLTDANEKEHFLGCLHIMQTGFSIQNAYAQVVSLKEAGVDILWYFSNLPAIISSFSSFLQWAEG